MKIARSRLAFSSRSRYRRSRRWVTPCLVVPERAKKCLCFYLRFFELSRRVAVDRNAAADIKHSTPAVDYHRPYRDAEVEAGFKSFKSPFRNEIAYRAHRKAAFCRLDLINDLHGPDLWRTCYRSARKQRPQYVGKGRLITKPPADRRNQMKQCRMLFDLAHAFDADASVFTHTAKVIAKKVNYHRVLGPVFFA